MPLDVETADDLHARLCSTNEGVRQGAVSDIYCFYRPLVFKRLRYKFYSIPESTLQDIVQDAFINIFMTKSRPESPAAMKAWVLKISINAALDSLRKAYLKQEIPWPNDRDEENSHSNEGTNVDEPLSYEVPKDATAGEHGANRQVEQCISQGIQEFGRKHPERETAISLVMDGHSIQEIGMMFHRTEHAMRQFIYESRKKLMPFIEHCLAELE